MYIDKIIYSNANTKNKHGIVNATITHTCIGYTITINTYDGRPYHGKKWHLGHIYKNTAKVYLDYTHAKGYSLKTAQMHVENIMNGKYNFI